MEKKWNGKEYNDKGFEEYELKDGKEKIKEYYDDGKLIIENEFMEKKLGKEKNFMIMVN